MSDAQAHRARDGFEGALRQVHGENAVARPGALL